MTWTEAEALFPGCSPKWDMVEVTAVGTWTIENMYLNSRGGLTVQVLSSAEEFESGRSVVRRYRHAYFSYHPDDEWLIWGRC